MTSKKHLIFYQVFIFSMIGATTRSFSDDFIPEHEDENISNCAAPLKPSALDEKTIRWVERVSEKAEDEANAASEAEPENSPPPGKYDLREPFLSKLKKSSHDAAEKCRTIRGKYTRKRITICGEQKSKRLCYRGVREALQNSGLAPNYPKDKYAIRAHRNRTLSKNGFKNVMSEGFNADNAPIGSILVYSGGPKGYGHIETKLENELYCSDFCNAIPATEWSHPRKLVGIYVFKKGTL